VSNGLQLSARSVASLLASIFGPSFYDGPRFGGGDPGRRNLIDLVSGPLPEPWREVMLNPQPLPPKELHVLALADAHIQEFLALDRIGTLLGGDVAERAQERALRVAAEIDELCPRWPRWPRVWPPPPPPPFGDREQMTRTELFVFGARFLAASELMEQGKLQAAVSQLGEKALKLSMPG
jgi:hypothetical protein